MTMMILELDCDGVLHPEPVFWHPRRGAYLSHELTAAGHRLFEHAELLQELLEPYPNVSIVLSTSWVRQYGFSRTTKFLTPALQARCVGATFHSRWMSKNEFAELPRGHQVLADIRRRRPSAWLALDDTDEGWPAEERSNVIITDRMQGIASPETLSSLQASLIRFSPSACGR